MINIYKKTNLLNKNRLCLEFKDIKLNFIHINYYNSDSSI